MSRTCIGCGQIVPPDSVCMNCRRETAEPLTRNKLVEGMKILEQVGRESNLAEDFKKAFGDIAPGTVFVLPHGVQLKELDELTPEELANEPNHLYWLSLVIFDNDELPLSVPEIRFRVANQAGDKVEECNLGESSVLFYGKRTLFKQQLQGLADKLYSLKSDNSVSGLGNTSLPENEFFSFTDLRSILNLKTESDRPWTIDSAEQFLRHMDVTAQEQREVGKSAATYLAKRIETLLPVLEKVKADTENYYMREMDHG